MLYIRQLVNMDSYSIVDTDDWVATNALEREILEFILDWGLDIKGVTIKGYPDERMRYSMRPYQLPDKLTELRIKTRMMKGVEVMADGEVVSSVIIREPQKQPVELRLSDFGHVMGDRLFELNEWHGRHLVTIILDDFLEYRECMLRLTVADPCGSLGVDGAGFKFDLQEVTHFDMAYFVYQQLFWRNNIEAAESVIDHEERKKAIVASLTGG